MPQPPTAKSAAGNACNRYSIKNNIRRQEIQGNWKIPRLTSKNRHWDRKAKTGMDIGLEIKDFFYKKALTPFP